MSRAIQLGKSSSRALKEDYAAWVAWCRRHRFKAMPANPRYVAGWIVELFEKEMLALATIRRRLWAISRQHRDNDHPDPTTYRVVKAALARIVSEAPPQRKAEILSDDDVDAMLQSQPETTIGRRNRALLVVAVAVQLNRSKLIAIDRVQLDMRDPARARVLADGRFIPLPPEAVKALQDWDAERHAAEVYSGALFRAVDRHGNIGARLGASEINRIFRSMARDIVLDKVEITSRSVLRLEQGGQRARDFLDRPTLQEMLFARNA